MDHLGSHAIQQTKTLEVIQAPLAPLGKTFITLTSSDACENTSSREELASEMARISFNPIEPLLASKESLERTKSLQVSNLHHATSCPCFELMNRLIVEVRHPLLLIAISYPVYDDTQISQHVLSERCLRAVLWTQYVLIPDRPSIP